jgi:NAD(P)-dependent dehydrogenase (short-subunit alcohol dehydrogenase family)
LPFPRYPKLAVRMFATDGTRVNAIAPCLISTDTVRAELSPEKVQYVLPLWREGKELDIVAGQILPCPRLDLHAISPVQGRRAVRPAISLQ